MKVKIEKEVPIPIKTGSLSLPWDQLDIGDSFLVNNDIKIENIRNNAQFYKKKLKRKFTCRRVEGGTRVWRIK